MSEDDREAFLADVHIGVLSIEHADGPPQSTPLWYRYEPGGDVELVTDEGSQKGQLLKAAGRATLCAQREEFPYAYVTVGGPVTIAPVGPDDVRELAIRYLGVEGGNAYADQNDGTDNVLVRITPDTWRSHDFSNLGAD